MTTFDPARTAANITLSNGNLTAKQTAAGGTNQEAFGSTSKASGKWYFSSTPNTIGASGVQVGLANSSATINLGQYLGWAGSNSFGWASNNGQILLNDSVLATIATYVAGNVLWLATDFSAKLFWGRVGAGNWNNSGTANPDTGVGGVSISGLTTMVLFAGINIAILNDQITFDFLSTNALTTFSPWDSSSLAVFSDCGGAVDLSLTARSGNEKQQTVWWGNP